MIYSFNMNNVSLLEELGYKVDISCNFGKENPMDTQKVTEFCKILDDKEITIFKTECPRKISAIKKIVKTYRQLKEISESEHYDLVHTQTPIGGVICRLAFCKARKQGTKVIYTAHGFHFYKGAPLKNWLLYYPVEKICSYFTDVLITINKEDYAFAQKKMKAKKTYYVPGVGIDLQKYSNVTVNKEEKRKELGVPDDAVLLLSVGELNENKNHETVIRALSMLDDPQVFYIIAGIGSKKEHLENVISELGLENNVHLIGYRNDVNELLAAADIFVFPSFREGLSVALMEAMACGLPVACSRIRGNVDLIDDDKGGVTFDPQNTESTANALNNLLKSNLGIIGKYNSEKIQNFDTNKIKNIMKKIYECLD
ncbi:MAG: glycosyltransferase family 4 protein [Ruminococcus sp.]|nr:glycosyltransferase family 4 protein [Ruminococcus sp.]